MNNCKLEEGPSYQCCCSCVSLVEDYSHPITDGKNVTNLRGYVCTSDGLHYSSGWPEHSKGCEMYTPRSKETLNTLIEKLEILNVDTNNK